MVYTSERLGGVADESRPAQPRVSVVVPARNEARHLEQLLPSLPDVHEVILVDGGSVDDTVATARRLLPDIRVTRQRRCDEGGSLAAGLAEVTGDVVVMLDADTAADPREIPRFVEALVDGADVAQGSRFREGGAHDVTPVRRLGNAVLNRIGRRVLGHDHSDLRYGFSAFWADLLPVLVAPPAGAATDGRGTVLWGDGFELERTAMSCRLAVAEATMREVPSAQRTRRRGRGTLRSLFDGLRVLTTLVTESRRLRAGSHLVVQRPAVSVPLQRPQLATSSRVAP